MTADEVIRALKRLGFEKRRQVGAHLRMVHKDRPQHGVTISVHGGTDLSDGNVASIIRQAGVSKEEFDRARRGK